MKIFVLALVVAAVAAEEISFRDDIKDDFDGVDVFDSGMTTLLGDTGVDGEVADRWGNNKWGANEKTKNHVTLNPLQHKETLMKYQSRTIYVTPGRTLRARVRRDPNRRLVVFRTAAGYRILVSCVVVLSSNDIYTYLLLGSTAASVRKIYDAQVRWERIRGITRSNELNVVVRVSQAESFRAYRYWPRIGTCYFRAVRGGPPPTVAPTTVAPTVAPTTAAPTTVGPTPVCQCTAPPTGCTFNRIVSGRDTCQRETPYYVFVNAGNSLCGGTLVNQNIIITAAHCVEDAANTRDIRVYFDKTTNAIRSGTERTGRFVIHPQYNTNTLANDIAVVILDQPVTYTATIRPACLSRTAVATGTDLRVSGWGRTASNQPGSTRLLTMQNRVVTLNSCRGVYTFVADGAFCTLADNLSIPSQAACNGDSGGPATRVQGNSVLLVGVVSAGQSVCGGDPATGRVLPSVFTEVADYVPWIEQTTGTTFCTP